MKIETVTLHCMEGVALPRLPYVVCNAIGEILRTGMAPGRMISVQAQQGEQVFVGLASDVLHYVDLDEGVVKEKKHFTPSVTHGSIQGLPPGTRVVTEGQVFYADDNGDIDLSYGLPGEYEVILSAPHYTEMRLTLQAVI